MTSAHRRKVTCGEPHSPMPRDVPRLLSALRPLRGVLPWVSHARRALLRSPLDASCRREEGQHHVADDHARQQPMSTNPKDEADERDDDDPLWPLRHRQSKLDASEAALPHRHCAHIVYAHHARVSARLRWQGLEPSDAAEPAQESFLSLYRAILALFRRPGAGDLALLDALREALPEVTEDEQALAVKRIVAALEPSAAPGAAAGEEALSAPAEAVTMARAGQLVPEVAEEEPPARATAPVSAPADAEVPPARAAVPLAGTGLSLDLPREAWEARGALPFREASSAAPKAAKTMQVPVMRTTLGDTTPIGDDTLARADVLARSVSSLLRAADLNIVFNVRE